MSENELNQVAFWVAVASGGALWALEGAMPFFRNRQRRVARALPNLLIAALNVAWSSLLLAGSLAMLDAIRSHWQGFKALVGNQWFAAALLVVGYDAWMYGWHRLNHQVPFLWRFHRFHHADEAMDVTTGVRFHPLELLFSELFRLPVLALLGMGAAELALYNLLAFPVILLHHSNVALPERIERALALAIPSPNLHRVHHSDRREESDANFGTLLSLWDRLFGTWRWRERFDDFRFGAP